MMPELSVPLALACNIGFMSILRLLLEATAFLFQFKDRNTGISLTVHTRTEGSDPLIGAKKSPKGCAKSTRPLAVNDPHRADTGKIRIINIFVNAPPSLVTRHASNVDLRLKAVCNGSLDLR